MQNFMLSCKKASELIDKKSVFKLSLKEQFMLNVHTSMCDVCNRYKKQSRQLDRLLDKYMHTGESQEQLMVNNELKEKIISKL